MSKLKTIEEIREYFDSEGVSVSDWAKENEVRPYTVYEVLRGNRACVRGESRKVAILLGLKEGKISK